jgi:hypothetical protein
MLGLARSGGGGKLYLKEAERLPFFYTVKFLLI